MSKVIEITENQYNAFVNGFDLIENKSIIDEALHYLKFLDKVKFETEVTVCDYVSDMIKNNENYLEKEFNLYYNLYLNNITFINNFIISHYRKTSALKLNIEQFDADRYKQMLSKWAERTLYRIAKRHYGVVQLYCDELTEIYTKKKTIVF